MNRAPPIGWREGSTSHKASPTQKERRRERCPTHAGKPPHTMEVLLRSPLSLGGYVSLLLNLSNRVASSSWCYLPSFLKEAACSPSCVVLWTLPFSFGVVLPPVSILVVLLTERSFEEVHSPSPLAGFAFFSLFHWWCCIPPPCECHWFPSSCWVVRFGHSSLWVVRRSPHPSLGGGASRSPSE